MSNQPISGYRNLTPEEISLINEIKAEGARVGEIIDRLEKACCFPAEGTTSPNARWLAISKTHLQQGFMFLVRAVAKPEGF